MCFFNDTTSQNNRGCYKLLMVAVGIEPTMCFHSQS